MRGPARARSVGRALALGASAIALVTAATFLAACARPTTAPAQPPAPAYVEDNIAVPMRDGVILRADVRRPAKTGRYPVLIFRTPYDKTEGDAWNESTFAAAVERGYAVVVQDVRGRYSSEGTFTAYENEGRDGYDTIEWAARQAWSSGNVGTFGLSYPGAVQWLAAVESPPHLKAMAPAMCFSNLGPRGIYFGGVFESAWAGWCYKAMSPDSRVRKNLPGPGTYKQAQAEWDRLGGADAIQGWLPSLAMPYLKDTEPYYYSSWLRHGPYDPWWAWGDLSDKYPKVEAAVLNISGWYDEPYGSEGAITNYLGIRASRTGETDPRTRLVLGPWIHGVDAVETTVAGDRRSGPSAALDYDDLVLDWMDRYVKGVDSGPDQMLGANAYQMGEEKWLRADTWPVTATTARRLYLTPGASESATGALASAGTTSQKVASFLSDPSKPVPDTNGTTFGAFDMSYLSGRPDVLAFETEPFTGDVRVVGHVGAQIYASADARDFDLFCKLVDVAPDGTALNLETPGHEVVRASYRDKTPERKLLKPDEVVKLDFDNLITGNTFKKGHRLRVYLTGSWFPVYSRNLQTGELETVSAKMRTARIKMHSGPLTPSSLTLPVAAAK